jgi:hypothetical protein
MAGQKCAEITVGTSGPWKASKSSWSKTKYIQPHSVLTPKVCIQPPRIRHIFQHDIANLQCRVPKSEFENFDIRSLLKVGHLST